MAAELGPALPQILQAGGGLGAFVLLGWIVYRQYRSDRQGGMTGAVEGYDKLVARLQEDLNRYSTELTQHRTELSGLRAEVGALRQDGEERGRQLRSAVAFTQRLLSYIADHLPHRDDVPPLPRDLADVVPTLDDWRSPPTADEHRTEETP